LDILFIHPNFPGQFRRLATAFAKEPECNVFATMDKTLKNGEFDSIQTFEYDPPPPPSDLVHRYNRSMESAIRRGEAICALLLEKKRLGFEPDIIIAHPGWGDSFFLKDIFPLTPIVGFFEYFYHARGADVGFDPEFPMVFDDIFRLRALNIVQLAALETCDVRISPTEWQKSLFPKQYQNAIRVVHEGIDTTMVKPNKEASLCLPDGSVVKSGDETLTFVSRSLEPYRGYHQFMRALPAALRARPECKVIIIGDHNVSYGKKPNEGETYMQKYLDEVKNELDLSRVYFTGSLDYADYLSALQVSRVHAYLTYPFVLSWSALEAMAAGCVIVASNTQPVREVIEDGENGILVDFFDTAALSSRLIEALSNPEKYSRLSKNAREYAVKNFDFEGVSFPAYKKLIQEVSI